MIRDNIIMIEEVNGELYKFGSMEEANEFNARLPNGTFITVFQISHVLSAKITGNDLGLKLKVDWED